MKFNYKLASVFGVPIYAHLSIVLVFFYFWATRDSLAFGLVAGCSFVILMLAHEIGHGWFALRYGHRVGAIKLYPIHGQCEIYHDPRYELESLVWAGGLLAQLALFIVFYSLFNLLEVLGQYKLIDRLEAFGYVFIRLNLFVLLFNFLPFPGLDGYVLWQRAWGQLKKRLNIKIGPKKSETERSDLTPKQIVDLAIRRAKKD